MARRRFTRVQRSLAFLIGSVLVLGLTAGVVLRRPTTPDWQIEGLELVSQGRFEAALRSFNEALLRIELDIPAEERDGIRIELLAARGECNLALGRERHALQDFREARRLGPDDPDLWLNEGSAHLFGERFPEAAELFEEAAERFADRNAQFRFAAGCARFQQSRADVTATVSRLLTSQDPDEKRAIRLQVEQTVYKQGATLALGEWVEIGSSTEFELQRLLKSARTEFKRADDLLRDYPLSHLMEPASGLLVIDMLRRSGRAGHAQQLCEILLQLQPEHEKAPGLRTLLANLHFNMGNYGEAGKQFVSNRGPLRRAGFAAESRRAGEFATECFLRADRPDKALELLNPTTILDSANIQPLFKLGVALWKNGDPDAAIRPLEKVTEILRIRHFAGAWARDSEHRAWMLASLAECLLQAKRPELALPVVRQAQLLFPSDLRWSRALVTLQDGPTTPRKTARRWLDVLRSGPRDDDAFRRWTVTSLTEWPTEEAMERQISERAKYILNHQAQSLQESRDRDSDVVAAFIKSRGNRRKTREEMAADAVLKAKGSMLLGSLENHPFLALRVYYFLRDQGHRDQAYLVLLALSEAEPAVEQFRALLAAHDYADGRLELAGRTWSELVHTDLQDWRSLYHGWSSLHRAGRSRAAQELERWALGEAPESVGQMLLTASCLRQGFLDQATAIAKKADPKNPVGAFTRGLGALAHARLGKFLDARRWSDEVLELDPGNTAAVAARLLSISERKKDETPTKLLREWESKLSRQAPEDLLILARALIANRDFAAAVRTLYWCIEQDASHIPARQDLVDCLIALSRTSEARDHLQRLEEDQGVAVDFARRTLLRLRAGEVDECYADLRAWSARGVGGEKSALWLAMVGAASNHISTALEVLPSDHELTDEQARFLALQIARHDQTLSTLFQKVPIEVLARLKSLASPQDGTLRRDHELEVSLSEELGSEEPGELSRSLLPLILLRDEHQFRVLREVWEKEVQAKHPALAALSLRVAQTMQSRGRLGQAVQVLVAHLGADPTDTNTLLLLQSWSNDLSSAQLDRVLQSMEKVQAPEGMHNLIAGLAAARQGLPEARQLLETSTEQVEPIGLALVPLLHLEQTSSLIARATPFPLSPFEAVQAETRRRSAARTFESRLEETLAAHPGDPALRAALVRYFEASDHTLEVSLSLRIRLVRVLLDVPAPPWNAYEVAARIAVEQSKQPDSLMKLAASLRLAMKRHPREIVGSSHLVRALVHLSRGLREFGLTETARGLLSQGVDLQPYDPDLLSERARFEIGRPKRAAELRARAFLCGNRNAEDLAWLAQDALEREQDLNQAMVWAERAISAFGPKTSANIEADVRRLRARLATLQGDRSRALKEFQRAARVLNIDPDRDLDRALALFASGSKALARKALSTVIDQPLAPRLLIQRALDVLGDAEEKEEEEEEEEEPTTAFASSNKPASSKTKDENQSAD